MLCDSCKKREARIHYTSVINGVVQEQHLCEICATGFHEAAMNDFPVHKLFEGLFNDKKCPVCNLSYENFRANGKLGCSNCYEAFGDDLKRVIKGIHGHTHHKGKLPKRGYSKISYKKNIEELNRNIEQAIKNEEYEKAAMYRDEIKRLKDMMNSKEDGNDNDQMA